MGRAGYHPDDDEYAEHRRLGLGRARNQRTYANRGGRHLRGACGRLSATLESRLITVNLASTRLSYAASATGAPGAGTWNVGMCVGTDGVNSIDNSDWAIGYAFVANGTPVSEAPKDTGLHRR